MQDLKAGAQLQGNKYKIIKSLGQGGFGITYLAEHVLLDRKVCIKELFIKDFCERDGQTSAISMGTAGNQAMIEKYREKFLKEAKLIAKLDHSNIIRIHDVFAENNTAYYVMDYIEGTNLNDMVKKNGALPENEALGYIKAIGNGLAYVHSKGINHLDVKPGNIMLRASDKKPVLIDFGMSKQYDEGGEQTSTTPVGVSAGYAPLEQYNLGGIKQFSPQTDVYSLGATLYRLITGKVPPVASEVMNEGLPDMRETISQETRNAIEKAMDPRKKFRFQSIEEFLNALPNQDPTEASNSFSEIIQAQDTYDNVNQEDDHSEETCLSLPEEDNLSVKKLICINCGAEFEFGKFCSECGGKLVEKGEVIEEAQKEEVFEEPEPVIVEEPEPVIVEEPEPVIVEEPEPAIVEEPEPVIVEEPEPAIVEELEQGDNDEPEFVDMGLSVRWATCNLGASCPEGIGDYYSWGEIAPKSEFDWTTYSLYDKDSKTFKKYCTQAKYGIVDEQDMLDSVDDAAAMSYGDEWSIPTAPQWDELIKNCNWFWITRNGISGYDVVSKINNSTIFLPAAGYKTANGQKFYGTNGAYWSSYLKSDSPMLAQSLSFEKAVKKTSVFYRFLGMQIRPVTTKKAIQKNERMIISTQTTAEESAKQSSADFVDLGLSVKWAKCNLGASKPEDCGLYYAWGETKTKADFETRTYSWFETLILDKGIYYNPKFESTKGRFLDKADAAAVNLGPGWKVPTEAEWKELIKKCDWKLTEREGIIGYLVSRKTEENIENSIFLPVTGYKIGETLQNQMKVGYYWASTIDDSMSSKAKRLIISKFTISINEDDRFRGFPIRPVYIK